MSEQLTKRQTEIVQAAIGLISDKGIQQLTMKKIAGRLEVSEPALYRHFDSKMDILLSILDSFRDSSTQIITQVAALEAPATDKLAALFGGFVARFAEQPSIASVIFAEEIFQDDQRLSEAVLEIMNGNQQIVLALLQIGQTEGQIRNDIPAEHLVALVLGSLRLTVARWRMSDHGFDLLEESRALWRSIERLICPQGSGNAATPLEEN